MIIKTKKGNVLSCEEKHVCFAINVEGINDSGLAGVISQKWENLRYHGDLGYGVVLSKEIDGRVFHAIACHSLGKDGWRDAPAIIKKSLDKIGFEAGEEIACVRFGAGPVGVAQGADADANVAAMDDSSARVVIYDL